LNYAMPYIFRPFIPFSHAFLAGSMCFMYTYRE
jgi:hypothetical protein